MRGELSRRGKIPKVAPLLSSALINGFRALQRLRVQLVTTLLSLIFTLSAAPLWAAPLPAPAVETLFVPTREPFYPLDDVDRELKLELEARLGVYLVAPPRRHRSERVELRGQRAVFHLWHPVAENSDQVLIARALRWLLFGRTRYSGGARAIFSETAFETLTLIFHEVLREEQGRRRRGGESLRRYLSLTLTRARFESLDLDRIEECLEQKQCARLARANFALKLKRRETRAARRRFRAAQR